MENPVETLRRSASENETRNDFRTRADLAPLLVILEREARAYVATSEAYAAITEPTRNEQQIALEAAEVADALREAIAEVLGVQSDTNGLGWE